MTFIHELHLEFTVLSLSQSQNERGTFDQNRLVAYFHAVTTLFSPVVMVKLDVSDLVFFASLVLQEIPLLMSLISTRPKKPYLAYFWGKETYRFAKEQIRVTFLGIEI